MIVVPYLRGILGIAVLLAIAWLIGNRRRSIPVRQIGWGIALQVLLALFILKTPFGRALFDILRKGAAKLISFSGDGAVFLFGLQGKPGVSLQVLDGNGDPIGLGFAVAFQVLPIIVFFSALIAILYHFGILQRIVRAFAFVMRKTMKISGAESLAVAANIFVGNVESPLVVRPYLSGMTRSELATVLVAGFGTIAGSVMAAYIGFGVDAGHLLAASVMSAPAAVVIAKLMFPETETPETMAGANIDTGEKAVNVIDATATGAIQGLKIAATVGAMLIAFLSLIALINYLFGFLNTSLGMLFGYLFAPLAWCMGVPSEDMLSVGKLLGTKVAINELVGYLELVGIKDQLAERSSVIATFALCGFANFGSIAIAIGGIGAIAPNRRADLARLGLYTMVGGALASFMTATIAGMML
jgi:concentrative nucleoside transporter, CNT family